MNGTYRLWHRSGSDWCDFDIAGESYYHAAHRRLLPPDWSGESTEVRRDFELIAEPENPHDPWAISVRADGDIVGYIPRIDAPDWAPVVRRVMASGLTPVAPGRMYAFMPREDLDWDGDRGELGSTIQLKLDDPAASLPINNPPTAPYTLLPSGAFVQVTKENEHFETLAPYVPADGYGRLFVTLHEQLGRVPRVEVRIDDALVGLLGPRTGEHYLPLVRHFERRGLVVVCSGDINGSALAAEVRISAVKAHEAGPELLDGEPTTLPPLVPAIDDPTRYDLSGMGGAVQALAAATKPASEPVLPQAIGRDQAQTATVATPPQPAPLPPANWYPDPYYPSFLRYWDGAAWTEHTAPNPW